MLCYAKKYKSHIRVVKKKGNEGGKNMIGKITKHKSAFTLAEGSRRPLLNLGQCRTAFTLAEVLITLSVIGIVAALTIPSMIENHNNKAWSTAKDLWDKKLVEATRQMNIDGVMTGVASSTEDYMNYFKKYVKVIKTCENDKLENCYAPKFVQTGDKETEVEVSSLTTASTLGQKDWGTNTMGFVIADGTTVVMAYNPNCSSVDPFSEEGQSGQVGCMSMLIDVNGKKGPNRVGDDIELKNATISTCDMKFQDKCIAASDIYPPEAINTCVGNGNEEYDDRGDHVYCATNRWAGAKKACVDNEMRLPTMQELADVATYIYKQDTPIGWQESRYSITPDSDRATELNWSIGWGYWSSEPSGSYYAYRRHFSSSNSYWYSSDVLGSGYRARCFSN